MAGLDTTSPQWHYWRARKPLLSFVLRLNDTLCQEQAAHSPSAQRLVEQARALLPTVRDGDDSGRECFEVLKRAGRRVGAAKAG